MELTMAKAEVNVNVEKTLSTKGSINHYIGNKPPLLAVPLIKLPTGSIRPEGWVRTQLELQADGFSGRLTEISPRA